jgi:small subunit ribosomal protein S1
MSAKSSKQAVSFSMEDFAQALAEHDYAFQPGQVVRGKVFNYGSEGAFIDIGGKSAAFLPVAEASLTGTVDLTQIVPLDQEREFLIIGEQNADGQVTLSIRRLEIKALWERLAEMQAEGQTIQVRVTGLNKGGVTVDVQGVRGFIPRSHLTERENLEQLKGVSLAAAFLEVDAQRNKLVLSQRQAQRSSRINELEIGQLVSGQVASLKPFGAFIDLEGSTGLLHIKEISQNYVQSLPAVLDIGEQIQAIIIDLDHSRGRISLSTKVLENRPGEMIDSKAEVMAEAEARAQRYQAKMLEGQV